MQRRALFALTVALFALIRRPRALLAQDDKPKFKAEELDQMMAPIALYPDPLLSQILMAASYPLEVVEAARWLKTNPTLKGDAAVAAVKDKNWDVSVKSLVAFPDVLNQMNEHLDWTQKLGDAMISQEADVADSVQRLRAKADTAGNLKSTPQQTVTTQGSGDNVQYIIEPANPEVVYVPSYNPSWAYGSWPYPQYPPVWYPFGGALMQGFFWGVGIAAAGAIYPMPEVSYLFNFNPPQSRGWKWCSIMRLYRAAVLGQIPTVTKKFGDHEIEDIALLWDKRKLTAMRLLTEGTIGRSLLVERYLAAVERYNGIAHRKNSAVFEILDRLQS